MEAKPDHQPTDRHETWSDHVLDMLPFIFAAFVVVLVVLAMMSPQIEIIYSNVTNII